MTSIQSFAPQSLEIKSSALIEGEKITINLCIISEEDLQKQIFEISQKVFKLMSEKDSHVVLQDGLARFLRGESLDENNKAEQKINQDAIKNISYQIVTGKIVKYANLFFSLCSNVLKCSFEFVKFSVKCLTDITCFSLSFIQNFTLIRNLYINSSNQERNSSQPPIQNITVIQNNVNVYNITVIQS